LARHHGYASDGESDEHGVVCCVIVLELPVCGFVSLSGIGPSDARGTYVVAGFIHALFVLQNTDMQFAVCIPPERPAFLFVVSLAAARTKILLSRTEQEIISEFNKYRLDMFH
jgi:hypothetical protein